ncbi:MAG: DUF4271 domain-containing protein [Bacteroidia bacterium]|nr:DUF4271 domain-containing protein [Bacteroidia bacterium]
MRFLAFVILFIINNLLSIAQSDSLAHINSNMADSTQKDSSQNATPRVEYKKQEKLNKDSIRNWNTVDSARIINPYYFHNSRQQEASITNDQHLRTQVTNFNYYYLLFFIFVVLLIFYSRFIPFKFKLQLRAFYGVSGLSELLSNDTSWFDTNKTLPFLISSVFISSLIATPLITLISPYIAYNYFIAFIGFLLFVCVFFGLRFIQTVIAHSLDFADIMGAFNIISLNTLYNLSLIGFPIIIFSLSFLKVNLYEHFATTILIIITLYSTRTLRGVFLCLRFEQRQLIYLIIYLCTLEIPLLLIGIKWISGYIEI